MIDFDTQDVYTSITIFGAIAGIIFVVIQQFVFKQGSLEYIIGGIAGALIIGLIVFVTRGMGEGDIEIAGVCGLFLGLKGILIALFLGIVIGGIAGIIILSLKIKNAKDRMAFGPFIA
ncbi:MAG TPA: prepilin peptidase, partial [Clostridium sp.]|nr:prepilin peptidase [Clostridium sp.]